MIPVHSDDPSAFSGFYCNPNPSYVLNNYIDTCVYTAQYKKNSLIRNEFTLKDRVTVNALQLL